LKLRQLGDSCVATTVCEMKREERTLKPSGLVMKEAALANASGLNVSGGGAAADTEMAKSNAAP